MRFGVFYEHQLPKPWNPGDEARLFHDALEQVVLADRLGYDYAWEVEHHFLEEYSHSSAPEVFLAACAALTGDHALGVDILVRAAFAVAPVCPEAQDMSLAHGRAQFQLAADAGGGRGALVQRGQEAARADDESHRDKVMSESIQSLLDLGYSISNAQNMIDWIHKGKIKNVTINF